jgi:hypothetical protein
MNERNYSCVLILAILLFLLGDSFVKGEEQFHWFKGQTHVHTVNSDGDDFPRRVVRWYRDHNYNFLVITDHDHITETKYLDTDKYDDFLLIPGEEVTDSLGKVPLHVNGINLKYKVLPQKGTNVVENLQKNIDAIRQAGGIAQINHPNWKWAFAEKEMAKLKNVKLFELYNMDKASNNFSAGGYAGMEEVWDRILSKGVLMYGVATDDAHDFEGEYRPKKSIPGRGWIMVKAQDLTSELIVQALDKGKFYATVGLGITLTDIKITKREYSLKVKPQPYFKYTTFFIGKDGKILKEDYNIHPVYQFKGDELYVRAKVFCSTGDFAITQPVFLKSLK